MLGGGNLVTNLPRKQPHQSPHETVDGNENCGKCSSEIQECDHGLQCERCDTWYCISCLNLSEKEYTVLSVRAVFHWFCEECENKALHAVRNDQEIEERCSTYMKNINERNEMKLKSRQRLLLINSQLWSRRNRGRLLA